MILVTGGTGLVGAHLLLTLTQAGHRPRAILRDSSSIEGVKAVFNHSPKDAVLFENIEWFKANLLDTPRLELAFKGITHVYHCAAYISFDPKKESVLRSVNIRGTANIVNFCLLNKVKKLCYVSSIATLGLPNTEGFIDENSEWNPEDKNSVYAIAKFGAELEAWRAAGEGMDIVMVNPGVIIGEGLWNSASGSLIPMTYEGMRFYTDGSMGVVDVKDVVRAMVQLMTSQIKAKRYILVGSNISYADFFTRVAKALGSKPPKRKIAKFWLRLLSMLDGAKSRLFGSRRKLTKATVHSLFKKQQYDASAIKTDLGFEFTDLNKTINRVASSYLNYRP